MSCFCLRPGGVVAPVTQCQRRARYGGSGTAQALSPQMKFCRCSWRRVQTRVRETGGTVLRKDRAVYYASGNGGDIGAQDKEMQAIAYEVRI